LGDEHRRAAVPGPRPKIGIEIGIEIDTVAEALAERCDTDFR
jgi:hypothetical protein